MTISGRLDDVRVGEVLQFIQLGSRSGTLVLQADGAEAEVEFREGRISSARTGTSLRLGELLAEKGLIRWKTLLAAIDLQRDEGHTRVLGEVLVGMGAITREALVDAACEHVQVTILEILGWSQGTFSFGLNEFPVQGTGTMPVDLLPELSLDTQMLMFQAAQIIDEKNVSMADEPPRVNGAEEPTSFEESASAQSSPAAGASVPDHGSSSAAETPAATVVLLSEDQAFVKRVSKVLEGRFLVADEAGFAGSAPLDGQPTVVALLDLRGTTSVESLRDLHARRPEVAIIVVTDSTATAHKALRAGAVANVYEDVGAVVACVQNISYLHRRELPELQEKEIAGGNLEKLRSVSREIRNSLLSTSVTLTLMRVLSELVERAVLFFVRPDCLVVLGAFGNSTSSAELSLAAITKSVRLPIDGEVLFERAIAERRPCTVPMKGAEQLDGLQRLIGSPASGQGVLLPVTGAESVILLVYADNGLIDQPVSDVDILELLASQVGVGIENELLRRHLSKRSAR